MLCHTNDHGAVQVLSLATGQIQQVSLFRAEAPAGVTETANWIPGTHQVLLFAQFLQSRQYLVGIGDAATITATPLPALAGGTPPRQLALWDDPAVPTPEARFGTEIVRARTRPGRIVMYAVIHCGDRVAAATGRGHADHRGVWRSVGTPAIEQRSLR